MLQSLMARKGANGENWKKRQKRHIRFWLLMRSLRRRYGSRQGLRRNVKKQWIPGKVWLMVWIRTEWILEEQSFWCMRFRGWWVRRKCSWKVSVNEHKKQSQRKTHLTEAQSDEKALEDSATDGVIAEGRGLSKKDYKKMIEDHTPEDLESENKEEQNRQGIWTRVT